MRIRYFVLEKAQQFEVFREDVSKGQSAIRARSIDLAKTLARLETRFTGAPTQVLVETSDGRMRLEMQLDPGPELGAFGRLVTVGTDEVLVRHAHG